MNWNDLTQFGILSDAKKIADKDQRNIYLFTAATMTMVVNLAITDRETAKSFIKEASGLISSGTAAAASIKKLNFMDVLKGRSIDPMKEWRQSVRVFARRWAYPQDVLDALG